jgi:hypothetical protein
MVLMYISWKRNGSGGADDSKIGVGLNGKKRRWDEYQLPAMDGFASRWSSMNVAPHTSQKETCMTRKFVIHAHQVGLDRVHWNPHFRQ